MKSIRKGLEKILIKSGILEKSSSKGILAASKSADSVRDAVSGIRATIVKVYKGKKMCKVSFIYRNLPTLFDAWLLAVPSKRIGRSYKTPITGGVSVGDEVIVVSWNGLSSSVVNVIPTQVSITETDPDVLHTLLDRYAQIVETYSNMFVLLEVENFPNHIIAQYQGSSKPVVEERVRIVNVIGSNTNCVPC